MYTSGAKQYQTVGNETGIMDADPHRLIQLLFDGALARLNAAKGHIERNEHEQRNKMLTATIEILLGLRDSLNMDAGDVANNLERLYDYMTERLMLANLNNDGAIVEEVTNLLVEIKAAWDAIRPEAVNLAKQA